MKLESKFNQMIKQIEKAKSLLIKERLNEIRKILKGVI